MKPIEADRLKDPNWRSPKDCQVCLGTKTFKWHSQTDYSMIADYECSCRDQWLMHRYFSSNGVAIKYQQLSWHDTFNVHENARVFALDFGKKMSANLSRGRGLYLYGPNGTGKTMVGTLLLKYALAIGASGFFTTFSEMLQYGSDGFKNDDAKEFFESKVRNSQMLMIDDPGKEMHSGEKQAEFKISMLDDVIRHRSASLLSTIVTSNAGIDAFGEKYGQSISSLMSETLQTVRFSGEDFREGYKAMIKKEEAEGLSRPVVVG